ncbi:MAG TPA: bifunctional 4-hydroxy-2-oxoglutarate aldolase/2-dehydro-3-deoxy-phosphogluconate aldolase [Vicinamibacterales bacterium]|nr:bifunctional 4-hydroxy-2-oxoglutarate aldolase/2-dehydro-3-deoxy-phosphogluconate aldolase [Vicinamibacterales bacterium]
MTTTTMRSGVARRIEQEGVVAVLRLTDAHAGEHIARALIQGGVTTIEITMTVPRAPELIADLSRAMPDALIGAGTVTDPTMARVVIDAGARFVVSPIFRPAIVEACHERDVPSFPGCFSPTEIYSAWEMGAEIVKVFPSTALGPAYLKDLRGPLPSIKLMPTGGVSIDNAAEWIRAGAAAIGVGSALVDARDVAAGRFDQITSKAAAFVAAVRGAR